MNTEYDGAPDKRTERIRSILYFLQFIENKIIQRQAYLNQDLEDCNGFARFMTSYLK